MSNRNEKIKKALAKIIICTIENSDSTQTAIANKLGVTQPRISSLVNGEYHKFSTDFLIDALDTLGYSVSIDVLMKEKVQGFLGFYGTNETKRDIKKVLANLKESL